MQADEWPAARMEEGGDGAWLRCVDGSDNESESYVLTQFRDYHQVLTCPITGGGQAGKSAPVGQLHQFALQNLDAYPPGVESVHPCPAALINENLVSELLTLALQQRLLRYPRRQKRRMPEPRRPRQTIQIRPRRETCTIRRPQRPYPS